MRTTTKYYRVEKRDIGFFKFIFEAYDGIAVVSTMDRESNIVALRVVPGCEADAGMVLQALRNDMRIEEIRENELEGIRCDEDEQEAF